MKTKSSFLRNTAITLVIVTLLVFGFYWLWQRQPKAQVQKESSPKVGDTKSPEEQKQPQTAFDVSPKDGTVTGNAKIKLSGKVNPNEFVLVFANSFQKVTKADASGNFQVDTEIDPGLNIINAVSIKGDLTQDKSISISLYLLAKDDPKEASIMYTGSVKSIFDKSVTLTTSSGEKTLRQKSSTKLIWPEDAKDKEDKEIRVGDFLIALGTIEGEKEFNAMSIKIIRSDKPQNTTQYIGGQILTPVKSNLFSAKNVKDNKVIEFTIDKNSDILVGDKEGKAVDIAKDKKAIVFYQNKDDKNLVKTIFLLP